MSSPSLDIIYTTDEAAERLRLSRRALIKLARKYGHCSRDGRDYLFSEADLLAIWQDMREPAQEPRQRMPVAPLPSQRSLSETIRSIFGPPLSAKGRALNVLKWLDKQRQPLTYAKIKDCGPRTIEELLSKGLVDEKGVDADGLQKVLITQKARNELRAYERWKQKREARTGRRL